MGRSAGHHIRVLVVDDSALVRSLISVGLSQHPRIEVVGQSADGVDAIEKIRRLRPDVVTLDVEMPRMNGIRVLELVAGKIPVSFLMVSSLTQAGAEVTLEALRKGALDYIAKPQSAGHATIAEFQRELHQKVLVAAVAKGRVRPLGKIGVPGNRTSTLCSQPAGDWLVAIGTSCGGPQALHEVLPTFPRGFAPIVITQHMSAQFTSVFARHLDRNCAMRVCEAVQGVKIEAGTIYIAPGSHHLHIQRQGSELYAQLDAGPPVNGHRPSVDVMFSSIAQTCGPRAVGVIMTGMGRDGADGIVRLKAAGARTIAQDESTSCVYGMPREAANTGRVDRVASLGQIPITVAHEIRGGRSSTVIAR